MDMLLSTLYGQPVAPRKVALAQIEVSRLDTMSGRIQPSGMKKQLPPLGTPALRTWHAHAIRAPVTLRTASTRAPGRVCIGH